MADVHSRLPWWTGLAAVAIGIAALLLAGVLLPKFPTHAQIGVAGKPVPDEAWQQRGGAKTNAEIDGAATTGAARRP